jgi:hypothetical protein
MRLMILKSGSFVVMFLVLVCQLMAKDTIRVKIYDTTADFIARKSKHGEVIVELKEKGSNHLLVKKIIDPVTNKKIKDQKFIWAIEYDSSYYVNMVYSDDQTYSGMYIKLDMVGGLYCITTLDKRIPLRVPTNPYVYGLGLQGALSQYADGYVGPEKLFKDKKEKDVPILFIDLNNIEIRNFSKGRNEGSLFNYLSHKELKKLLMKHDMYYHESPTLEDVIDLIGKINDGKKF